MATEPQTPSNGCGSPPKRLAIGIAPLGIISIGIVPMGVVSIGVVPMGVVSLGAVGMGVINACVVGMGVLVAGVNVMGVWSYGVPGGPASHGHQHSAQPYSAQNHSGHRHQSDNLYAYPSKQVALQKAKELGCQGVHPMGTWWMPCAAHPGEAASDSR